ncbi:hypothetical protein QYE76_004879 [Lolium multiflorum]|uniref:Uncharacterized protein n=1 Tax=Lolium multiflorum TaxID=4521 RepID=A0AAD8RSX9_LOLMU|nr:hypothetical protein QYE76_004879 [Lolium multiflorum]
MVKKKNPSAAATSGGAAKSSSILPKEGAPNAPPQLRHRRATGSVARPGDWIASTVTKRDEKRSRSLGLISSDEGNVIFPAVEETRASPMKRSIGGFADEDDLLDIDEALAEPPPKKARSDAVPPAAAASEASAPKAAPAAQASTASSLSKGKDVPAATTAPPSAATTHQEVDSLKEELGKLKERLKEEEARAAKKDELLCQSALALLEAANISAAALDKVPSNSPKMDKTLGQLIDAFAVDTKEVIEVFPVPSFVDDSWGVLPEGDRIQRMKDRITQMEKDLRSTYALAPIASKKSEIAADVERYALTELHKATESLNFPTLLTLMYEFGNAKKIRDLVRAQVFAGARFTLALVLARYPSNLLSIANATGDLEALYPKVLLPANIIVDRLEEDSKVPEERGTPQG